MADNRIGLVVNAGAIGDTEELRKWPQAIELEALGPRVIRAKVYDFELLRDRLNDGPKIPVIVCLDSHLDGFRVDEPPIDVRLWKDRVQRFADAFGKTVPEVGGRVIAVECL